MQKKKWFVLNENKPNCKKSDNQSVWAERKKYNAYKS